MQRRDAHVWRDNVPAAPLRVVGNQLTVTIAPKGLVAFAIPATVKPGLQARLYDPTDPPLGLGSLYPSGGAVWNRACDAVRADAV